jgi:hypothetical protein
MSEQQWYQCQDCGKAVRLKAVFGTMHVCNSLRTEVEVARSNAAFAKGEYERHAQKRRLYSRRRRRDLYVRMQAAQAINAQLSSIELPSERPMIRLR